MEGLVANIINEVKERTKIRMSARQTHWSRIELVRFPLLRGQTGMRPRDGQPGS